MKGFIKVTDVGQLDYYVNIDYIIQLTPISEGNDANTYIHVRGTQKTTFIHAAASPEEIINMIDMARS